MVRSDLTSGARAKPYPRQIPLIVRQNILSRKTFQSRENKVRCAPNFTSPFTTTDSAQFSDCVSDIRIITAYDFSECLENASFSEEAIECHSETTVILVSNLTI
ncbi:hypothetical protein HUJ04_012382 [Dendroctonus ponderosae]|nr:hypothetical protein HUJ04_012382 [Dendroctonus ponderosae]KAH1029564.1 hypothetical protein HUJ05_002782 [Dendroctonus ponderosae]